LPQKKEKGHVVVRERGRAANHCRVRNRGHQWKRAWAGTEGVGEERTEQKKKKK